MTVTAHSGARRSRLLRITLGLALVFTTVEVAFLLQTRSFDRELWRQAMDHSGGYEVALDQARWEMARRLARYDRLEGLDRGQVRAMLGEPSSHFERGEWWYNLGGHGVDTSGTMLALRFGEDGRVDRDWILQLP